MAKEMIAMLLAGGQKIASVCIDPETCKACRSVWWKVPDYRFPAFQLCQFRD